MQTSMKFVVELLLISVFLPCWGVETSLQDRMRSCNQQANGKVDQERKDFMRECLGVGESAQPVKKNQAIGMTPARRSKLSGVRIGMTSKQVRESTNWGNPEHVNRTINSLGTSEQWVYGEGNYLYFVNGQLSSIQTKK